MILLIKNSVNDVYLTLREKSSIVNQPLSASTNYLFNFRNDETFQDYWFIPLLISSTNRADRVRIIETGQTYVNLTGGTIHLTPQIFYHYFIYENLTNPYNLFLSGTTGVIIEQGKVLLSGLTNEVNYLSFSGSATPNYVFTTLT